MMIKSFLALLVIATSVYADDKKDTKWWDPLSLTDGKVDMPILAKLTPTVQNIIPANVQSQLARVTGKDLLGLRALAERMTVNPTSRAEFIKELNSRAPNVLFLGTEVYKVGRDQYEQIRKNLSPDAMKFLRNVVGETESAVNDVFALFSKQDVGTKANLQAIFPFVPQLLQSSKNSVQYVRKNF